MEWNVSLPLLILNLEMRLEMITKWLRDSGLVVNESKTEACLFHTQDQPLIEFTLQGVKITTKKSMNVLGVIFDSKLNWQIHVATAITKAKKALFALRLLKKYFSLKEMRLLLDANFYSILYYNAVIWLTPSLSSDSKQSLLSISATALRSCLMHEGFDISFDNLHKTHKKCTPSQIMNYQLALNLHKTLNFDENDPSFEIISVLDQLICTRRQTMFRIFRNSNSKIGFNTTANKYFYLNDKIGLEQLSLNFLRFKKAMKIKFLKYGTT